MTTISLHRDAPTATAGLQVMASAARLVHRLDATWLRSFVVRRAIKGILDLGCGLAAVAIALLVARPAAFPAAAGWLLAAGTSGILLASHALGGSYREIWRYTGFAEAIVTVAASLAVFIALLAASAIGLVAVPAALALQVALLTLVLCAGVRVARRWQMTLAKSHDPHVGAASVSAARRVLIAGAGEHGLSIARDLLRNGNGLTLVGFLDDDLAKIGAAPLGVPVLGPLVDALSLAERHQASEIIVAMPFTSPDVVRTFVRRVEDGGLRARTVGGVARFIQGAPLHRPGQTTARELLAEIRARPPIRSDAVSGRLLVTGGAGFIGSHLTRMALERGYHVRVLDRFDYGRAGLEAIADHRRLEIMAGDITSSRDLSRALKGVDGVIALAAIVGDPACNLYPDETVNLNYLATKILIDACNFHGVRRLVFASSCSVYGANNEGLLTERSRLTPVSLYARTRVLSENVLFDRHGDLEPVVLRLATVFGLSPRMRFDLVVNTLTARAVVDGRISVFGGNQWRPHVHCRDVARAFLLALEAPAAAVTGEIFNVGSDASNLRIDELADLVAELVGDVDVRREGDIADPRDYRVSFAKIREVLGFVPEFSVAAGIREVAAAVRATPHFQRFDDPVFHNVKALRQAVVTPRRRRDDYPAVRQLA